MKMLSCGVIAISALLLGMTAQAGTAASATAMAATTPAADASTLVAPKLHVALRALWQGHVLHTREYAVAVHAHNASQANAAADAVVANAKQLADAVGSFYGDAAGAQMLTLLAGHWGGVKALTDARAAGDMAAQSKAMSELAQNVSAISAFLSGANPNLPESALQGLLSAHVGHHATQIQQIMADDVQGERQTWKAMQHHMDVIADALADGIAAQFPDKAN
ncbi:MAG: hypothetical protein Q8L45_04725 [Xanthomonadaceae bacterium]|nr:hypothetical protein [Xanthomonadaceae bacterium]MDP2184789.1 hypothetical protein [Xanthomonadales bacterium]MDZ4116013.1 hypothetical protein [Xanthomonadaceae bacterium]MDZ4378391.1 hypothetical protein [Xanthomonadaceae bacterium]